RRFFKHIQTLGGQKGGKHGHQRHFANSFRQFQRQRSLAENGAKKGVACHEQAENRAVIARLGNRVADGQACENRFENVAKRGTFEAAFHSRQRQKSQSERQSARGQSPAGIGKEVAIQSSRQSPEDADKRLEPKLPEETGGAKAQ